MAIFFPGFCSISHEYIRCKSCPLVAEKYSNSKENHKIRIISWTVGFLAPHTTNLATANQNSLTKFMLISSEFDKNQLQIIVHFFSITIYFTQLIHCNNWVLFICLTMYRNRYYKTALYASISHWYQTALKGGWVVLIWITLHHSHLTAWRPLNSWAAAQPECVGVHLRLRMMEHTLCRERNYFRTGAKWSP